MFSADNQYLATGSGDDTAKVWSVKGGEPLLTLEQGDEYDVTGVAFSPDGHQLLTGDGENRVKLWDTAPAKPTVFGAHAEAVSAVGWSADGKWVVSGGWDDVLKIWNTETGQARTLRGHTDDLTVLASCWGDPWFPPATTALCACGICVPQAAANPARPHRRGHQLRQPRRPPRRFRQQNELKFWELK